MWPPCWQLWRRVAAAAALALALALAVAGEPVVGPAKPRFKGFASEKNYGRMHSSLISGKYAKSKAFPYQVYLRVFLANGTVDFCGGAIIGVRHILSAAHCVDKPRVIKIMAVIGSEHRFGRRALKYRVIRQTFYEKKPKEQVDADIVVLMVDRPMPLGRKTVKRLRLQTNRNFNKTVVCSVAGWGESRDNLDPNLLKYVKVPIVKPKRCRKAYPFDPPEDLLCAGFYEHGGSDTCQGDSGGPLVCSARLTGVVKGGVGCGVPRFPGTYTDVSYYAKWVHRVMKDDWRRYFKKAARSTFSNSSRLSLPRRGTRIVIR